MLRVTLKGVQGHLLRFLLTVVSVTLGTALIAGTFVLTDSINATFDSIFDTVASGIDVSVRGQKAGILEQGEGNLREQLPVSLVDRLRQVDGVERAEPDLQGSAVLVGKDGTAVRSGGAPTLAFAYFPDDTTLQVMKGRGPASAGEVAVESATLARSKLVVGDVTSVVLAGRPQPVTIVGEVKFDASMGGASMIVFDRVTAAKAFAPDGKVQSFSVVGERGVGQSTLRDRVAQVLPRGVEAITGAEYAKEQKKALRDAISFISTFLFVFAAVSVFVGGFIISNTFSMLVTQRTRELALLRAVGASRAQVLRVILGEAAVVGLAGGLVGLGVGTGLARGLQEFFAQLGLEISGGLPVTLRTIVVTLLVGALVTVISAVRPALRASRIAPMAALRDDMVAAPKSVRLRGAVGIAMLGVGAVLATVGVTGSSVSWLTFAAGAVLLVLGALLAAPLAARPVVRVVAAPFVMVSGTVGRLARENVLRVPRRTATTASALMIGLALIGGISVVAQSTKASISDVVGRQLTTDFVLSGGGQTPFPTTVAQEAAKLPGVRSVSTVELLSLRIGTGNLTAIVGEARGITENVRTDVTSGSLSALDRGELLVDETTAKNRGWQVGSTLTATVGSLTGQQLTVGGIYKNNPVLGPALAPRSLYLRAVPPAWQSDWYVYVKAKPGQDVAALRTELTALVKPFLVVSVQDGAEFTDSQAEQVNTMLTVIYVLLALSVIIAVLGVVNTLALSVFERTREIGLLRAVGLSRRQLSATITIEAVAIAVFGAVLGITLGLCLGIGLRQGLADQGLGMLVVPWTTLIMMIVMAAVAGVIAAVLPAIRATRLDVLRAIVTE
jgi:putative ABC transport system permease protein